MLAWGRVIISKASKVLTCLVFLRVSCRPIRRLRSATVVASSASAALRMPSSSVIASFTSSYTPGKHQSSPTGEGNSLIWRNSKQKRAKRLWMDLKRPSLMTTFHQSML